MRGFACMLPCPVDARVFIAAFVRPMPASIGLVCGGAQVLMLVPTRELALQTSAIVKEIGKHTGVQCMVSGLCLCGSEQDACFGEC